MNRTRQLVLCTAVAILCLGFIPAFAQPFPSKPIKIITAASAGTSTDALARFFAEGLQERLKVPVVVDNRGGAGGLLGYITLMKSNPDGYTVMASGLPRYLLPLSPETTQKFDPINDFTFISRVARTPLAFVVPADSPYQNLNDLIQAMKAKPKDLTFSSQGVGSSAHICGALLNDMTKTKATHVPYKDSSMAVTDVAGGRVNFTCQGSVGVLPLVKAGKLRALAVTSSTRWDSLPEVPTVAQAGVPGFEMSPGIEFIGPAGMPPAVVQTLSDAILQTGRTPQYGEMLAKHAISLDLVDHKALADLMPKEFEYWKRATAIAGGS